jgi:hypothetical protein
VEKFSDHIEKLLAQHEYVVVPGLGGFVVQHQSAKILDDCIFPPLDTIGFNPLMLHADGLLAIEISRTQKISYRQAMEYIQHEVENIHIKLNISSNVQLGNLGMIQKNNQGNLLFQPVPTCGFLPQNLGLSEIYASEKKKKSVAENRKVTITLPSNRTFRYAATILLIIGLFAIAPRVTDVKNSNSANLASLNFVNSIRNTTPLTVDSTKLLKKSEISSDSLRFHVIVAGLPGRTGAEKYCSFLQNENFQTAHVVQTKKYFLVAIQSFNSKTDAINYMQKLRSSDDEFEFAWVLCN